MAPRGLITLALALAFVATLWCGARAQTTGCTTTLINLAPCLTYITGNSSTPSSTCCTSLAGVVQTSPQCLCSVINGTAASNLGVAINQTAALQLPTACNVQTPPLSQCNAVTPSSTAGSPAFSPTGSPTGETTTATTATTPSASTTPSSGTGSKTTPSTTGTSSGASIAKVSSHLVVFLLFLAMCASRV